MSKFLDLLKGIPPFPVISDSGLMDLQHYGRNGEDGHSAVVVCPGYKTHSEVVRFLENHPDVKKSNSGQLLDGWFVMNGHVAPNGMFNWILRRRDTR